MLWLTLLLWALSKAIEYLLSRPRLTESEKVKFNTAIARARQMEMHAVSCGCLPGGRE